MNKNRRILSFAVPCFCLISSQERANKHKFYLIFDTKSTFKKKQAKNIFYIKIKMNQVSVLVLPDWKLLCQASEMQFFIQLYNDI